jgi:hypothetical protein
MSEYQYYEFLAMDRALDKSEMAALRKLSSRAEITPTRFANEYHWGDFKGSPEELMAEYFDAHVYVANWGTHRLMLRLPEDSVDEEVLMQYVVEDALDFWDTEQHCILKWLRSGEAPDEWVEGQGWMTRLAPIREEIERGDYRALYLGWLYGAGAAELPEDTIEPPLPAGLGALTGAQEALAEFLGIDPDLLAAATAASPPLAEPVENLPHMLALAASIPAAEAHHYLVLLLQGKGRQAERELRRRYAETLRSVPGRDAASAPAPQRTLADLTALAREAHTKRLQREKEQRQREQAESQRQRQRYLATLAEDFERHWKKADALANEQRAAAYDQARTLLVDLSEAYALKKNRAEFLQRLAQFRAAHGRRGALLRRLDEAGLTGKP